LNPTTQEFSQLRTQLKLEALQLSRKVKFTQEDSSRAALLLRLAESPDSAVTDELRSLRARTAAAQGPSEFRNFLTTRVGGKFTLFAERPEFRDMGVTTGAVSFGSPLGPSEFFPRVLARMKATDSIFEACRWISVPRGTKFSLPTVDDTGQAALVPGEGFQDIEQDIALVSATQYDQSPFWRSGAVQLSFELLQDSGADLESLFAELFAIRFARGIGADFISTLLSSASVGATASGDDNAAAPDGSTQVGYADLLNLLDSVDSAYVESPGAGWLMRRSTLTKIANLRDKQGLPLPASKFEDGKFWLLGFPVRLSPSMPAIAASSKSIAFGDLSRFIGLSVGDFEVKRYNERRADQGLVEIEAYWRVRGALADAAAVTVLQQHS
jgi:HK97 family phage major capsid protein